MGHRNRKYSLIALYVRGEGINAINLKLEREAWKTILLIQAQREPVEQAVLDYKTTLSL